MEQLEYPCPALCGRYKLGDVLGRGGFAIVAQGVPIINNTIFNAISENNDVAIKIVSKSNFDEKLKAEVTILQLVNHPSIVKLYETLEDDDNYYIVLELLRGGELFARISKMKYNESSVKALIVTILDILVHLQTNCIIHRDIKAENLLFDSYDNLKLIDFGTACICNNNEMIADETQCCTLEYSAPEIIEGKPYNSAIDMWAVGVLCYVLLVGYFPFDDMNKMKLMKKIKKGVVVFDSDYWKDISVNAKDFISQLLMVDPNSRMKSSEALRHPWFTASASDDVLLNDSKNRLKTLRIRRKFRATISAIIAVQRITRLSLSRRGSRNSDAPVSSAIDGSDGGNGVSNCELDSITVFNC